MTMLLWMPVASMLLWLVVLMLPWRPWLCREHLDADREGIRPEAGDITVLIPARNEERTIAATLRGIACQGSGVHVVMVDDESTDDTCRVARKTMEDAMIVRGTSPPEGWTGKLWALEQGYAYVKTPFILLLDADIELRPGVIRAMLYKMQEDELSMLFLPGWPYYAAAMTAWLLMGISYFPVLEFYGRSPLWGLLLPLTAVWYLAMTWLSAFRYWKGEQSRWKGRSYMRSNLKI